MVIALRETVGVGRSIPVGCDSRSWAVGLAAKVAGSQ